MLNRNRTLRIGTAAGADRRLRGAVAGCGGSSGSAAGLLRQTFCGQHTVRSGNLKVALTLTPSGSRTLTGPVSLSLSGPFQSLGSGKLPSPNLRWP